MDDTIDHGTLSRLLDAGSIRAASIVARGSGWSLVVRHGKIERTLTAQRSGQVRIFRRLETLVIYLKNVGFSQVNLDFSDFEPGLAGTSQRPDRSEALKRVHAAADYDKWLKDKVQASIDDPRPSISDKEARARFAAIKDKLRNSGK